MKKVLLILRDGESKSATIYKFRDVNDLERFINSVTFTERVEVLSTKVVDDLTYYMVIKYINI